MTDSYAWRSEPFPLLSPHPEEPCSGVSKDVSGDFEDNWSILRDAILRIAPQDEG
jgi:hypothetical protein